MEFNEILKQVNQIFIREMDKSDIVLIPATTARDVPEWDSLMQITLVVAIEKHFKVKFTSSEIQNFKNVGEMCQSIQGKLQ